MTDQIQIVMAAMTFLMAIGTLIMAWRTHNLAQIASLQVMESVLLRKRGWEKEKIKYLHDLQDRIENRIGKLPNDSEIESRILPENRNKKYNSLDIERDRINKTELFFLLSETFLLELAAQSEKYDRIAPKKQKRKEDFVEMRESLNILKKIMAKELGLCEKELKSITLELNKKLHEIQL